MPNYRRMRTPGATWFFTVNLLARRDNDLLTRHIDLLPDCVAAERARRPFRIDAWVVLPEHSHWLWTLPDGDSDYSTRWRRIKTDFSRAIPPVESRSITRVRNGERAIWQRRFWEHQIRDDADYAHHLDDIHINPVKHGHVSHTADWPHSSFTGYVERGVYSVDWAADVAIAMTGER
ncbi:MAG: transposase [Pseudomonadota bacterium]|nr:transposase [Pseudomonadota bacterium]